MYRTIFLFIVFSLFYKGFSQNTDSYLVVYFDSKNQTTYSLENPAEFLTERAIDRRTRFSIPIDSADLPVNQNYIDSLFKLNIAEELLYTSRWLNCAVVRPKARYKKHISQNWIKNYSLITIKQKNRNSYSSSFYEGKVSTRNDNLTAQQLNEIGISKLHKMGLTGKGVLIAVLDAGYRSVNTLPLFDSLRNREQIIATRDFAAKSSTVYSHHNHGTAVLALLAGVIPDTYRGSAPEANYILIRTENAAYESRLEEFNWLAGAEYADSLGADILNSSLGYNLFDNQADNYTINDLTGNVAICSKAAGIAASKGMVVVSSAGNDGDTQWRYLNFPADNPDIFTIGATDSDGVRWSGSSIGMSFHVYKPDFMSRGKNVWVPSTISEGFYESTGTSYSAPIFAGGVACLLQYYNDKSPLQIKQALKETAINSDSPNNYIGYGLPDFYNAFYKLQNISPPEDNSITINKLFYDKSSNTLNIDIISATDRTIYIDVYDSLGRTLQSVVKETSPGLPLSLVIPIPQLNMPQIIMVAVHGKKGKGITRKIMLF